MSHCGSNIVFLVFYASVLEKTLAGHIETASDWTDLYEDKAEHYDKSLKIRRLSHHLTDIERVFDADIAKSDKCVEQDKLSCTAKCQQGKVFYPSGCCLCICRKNYVLRNHVFCHKATWTKWNSWSKCLKADWGGLQTRQRVCKSHGRLAAGSCVGRGSISRTCSDVKKDFRIRKNVKDLTDAEVHDLIQAMTKFKKDRSKKGYRHIASWHGWPGLCPWYGKIHDHKDNKCSWHHHPLFLPWHRMITLQLELGLQRHMENKTLGIPYWDWTENSSDVPYLIRYPMIYDRVLNKYVKNPFYKSFIKRVNGVKIYSQRHPWYPGILMDNYLLKGMVRALLSHDYYNFDEQQSANPHDQIHDCFCQGNQTIFGEKLCTYSLWETFYSSWDPVFFLHHSAIDRLFVMRRVLLQLEGTSDWTKERVVSQYLKGSGSKTPDYVHCFDWPLSPFCNKSINPERVTLNRGVWLIRNNYYNEGLFGYKYADFNMGHNYTWRDLRQDYRRNVKERDFWNDEFFDTKIGALTKKNSYSLKTTFDCSLKYSDPKWNMSIIWNGSHG